MTNDRPPAPKMPVLSGRVVASNRATLTVLDGGRPSFRIDYQRWGRTVAAKRRNANDSGPPSLPPATAGRRAA